MAKRLVDIDMVKDEPISEGGENRKSSGGHIITNILVVLVIVALAAAGWFYWKYTETQKFLTGAGTEAEMEQEIKEVTAAVGKLMILPDEKPQIATVVDPDTLVKEQPFYEGVNKGDKVLFYAEAKRAIIYSPSRNIVGLMPARSITAKKPTWNKQQRSCLWRRKKYKY